MKLKNFFSTLETLELDRNYLAFVQALNAPKLKHLNLDGNYLGKKIEKKIFANLLALERLHLRDNQIEFIDPNAFQNTRLQSLGKSFEFSILIFNLSGGEFRSTK